MENTKKNESSACRARTFRGRVDDRPPAGEQLSGGRPPCRRADPERERRRVRARRGRRRQGGVKKFVRMMNERAARAGLDTRTTSSRRPRHPGPLLIGVGRPTRWRGGHEARPVPPHRRATGGEIAGGRTLFAWNDLLKTYPGDRDQDRPHRSRRLERDRRRRADGVTMYAVILGGPRAIAATTTSARSSTGASATTGVQVISKAKPYAEVAVPFSDEGGASSPEDGAAAVSRSRDDARGAGGRARFTLDSRSRRATRWARSSSTTGTRSSRADRWSRPRRSASRALPERVRWYAGRALDEAGDMLSSLSPF